MERPSEERGRSKYRRNNGAGEQLSVVVRSHIQIHDKIKYE